MPNAEFVSATLFLILLEKKYCVKVSEQKMMFSTSPSITRSTSVPGMVPGDDRPPFVTFNKEAGFYISPEKEHRFQVNAVIDGFVQQKLSI